MNKNFFDFYGIEETLNVDKQQLRKSFLLKSREFHPDLMTSVDGQDLEGLDSAALNNLAYETLQDLDKTIMHLFQMYEVSLDAKAVQLPTDFLMEMMDVNEEIEEISHSGNNASKEKMLDFLNNEEYQLLETHHSTIDQFRAESENKIALLEDLRIYILKKNYIKRMKALLANENEI